MLEEHLSSNGLKIGQDRKVWQETEEFLCTVNVPSLFLCVYWGGDEV